MKPFRVILIAPPIHDFYATPARMEPLGLLYIAAALRRMPGVRCDVYDAAYSMKKKRIRTPECFGHLRDIYTEDTSHFSLLSHFFRFGDSFDRIVAAVREGAYDLVGVSSMFSGYHPDVEALAARIKAETKSPVAIGGWAVFADADRLAGATAADFLISGDGETAFPELVRRLMDTETAAGGADLPRRGERTGGTVRIHGGGVDDSPLDDFPEREAVYRFRGRRIARMVLSRGCRHSCAFCAVPRRYAFTARSIESISRELEYLHGIGVGIVDFEDDNLFHDQAFSRELMTLLREHHAKGMSFAAMNGITAPNLVPFVNEAIDAGFIEFNVSLVTGSASAARGVNRPSFREAVRVIAEKSAGRIPMLAFIIGGLPGTTPAGVIDDIVFLAGLPLTIGFSPLYLLPGLPVFEALGLPDDARLLRGSALWKFGEGFAREDVASLWKYVRMINRLKATCAAPTDDERDDLRYFSRSLREKTWYAKRRDGRWERTFRFSIDLPMSLRVTHADGESALWDFDGV
ncbi:MAG TPA: cobalamin-dependent protein [Spirochaetota bacterium]|nr:cobalamin-dependent protein [Spirochaetota bacterium]HPU87921.1 cobalamin-dependent protein [Spirochaetota bacterium]